ncbi:hypothetical protein Avbf_01589 [Armadillidium vulgare]|nr:hypothetical protein Avbf_01589 [Armadillidium vulgare]
MEMLIAQKQSEVRIPIKIKGRSDIMGSSPGLYMSESWGLTLYSNTSEESTIGFTCYNNYDFNFNNHSITRGRSD